MRIFEEDIVKMNNIMIDYIDDKDKNVPKRHKWKNDICVNCGCERMVRPATDGFIFYKKFTQYNNGNGWMNINPNCIKNK